MAPLVRQSSLASITDLVAKLRSEPMNGLHVRMMRGHGHDRNIVLPRLASFRGIAQVSDFRPQDQTADTKHTLNIWCAASSTGQEPYSLALLVHEHFPELSNWKVNLLASDLSRDALERARQGKYMQIEVNRGLPAAMLVKYFDQQGTHWQLRDGIRRLVRFEEINLMKGWPVLPRMDLIMIRNVLIYFDVPTKKDILRRLSRLLRPDGYLLLGGAETTLNLDASFRRVEHNT